MRRILRTNFDDSKLEYRMRLKFYFISQKSGSMCKLCLWFNDDRMEIKWKRMQWDELNATNWRPGIRKITSVFLSHSMRCSHIALLSPPARLQLLFTCHLVHLHCMPYMSWWAVHCETPKMVSGEWRWWRCSSVIALMAFPCIKEYNVCERATKYYTKSITS